VSLALIIPNPKIKLLDQVRGASTFWFFHADRSGSSRLERPGVEFKIFQFPPDKIPRIDGQVDDWAIVRRITSSAWINSPTPLAAMAQTMIGPIWTFRCAFGWVKGINHLYFLYEASDNYWDFARPDLHNDIFEVVVDGDLSGGPFIKQMHPHFKDRPDEAHFSFHGVHAQNYHIFTPAEGRTGPWCGVANRG